MAKNNDWTPEQKLQLGLAVSTAGVSGLGYGANRKEKAVAERTARYQAAKGVNQRQLANNLVNAKFQKRLEAITKAENLTSEQWGKLSGTEKADLIQKHDPRLLEELGAARTAAGTRAKGAVETALKNTEESLSRAESKSAFRYGVEGAKEALTKPRLATLSSAIGESPLGFFERTGSGWGSAAEKAIAGNGGKLRGLVGAGTGKLIHGGVASLPYLGVEWAGNKVLKKDDEERVNSIHDRLTKQGISVTKDDVSRAYQLVGDPFREQGAWWGMGKGHYHGGKTLQQFLGFLANAPATAIGGLIQTGKEGGAENEVDNAIYEAIRGDASNRDKYNARAQNLSPEMAQGLHGDMLDPSRSNIAKLATAFGGVQTPLNKGPQENAYQKGVQAKYASEDASTRWYQKGAAERGGSQYYQDLYQNMPFYQDDKGNFIKRGTEDNPEYIDPKVAKQAYDAYLSQAGVISQDDYNTRYFGTKDPMGIGPQDVVKNANSPAGEVKRPSGGGPVSVYDSRGLPQTRLSPPTTPEEALNNIHTSGVARGLSPIAAEQENYMNSGGMRTARQFDSDIAASLKDQNSSLNSSLSRMRAQTEAAGRQYGNPAFAGEDDVRRFTSNNSNDAALNNAYKAFQSGMIGRENLPQELLGQNNEVTSPRDYRESINPTIQAKLTSEPKLASGLLTINPTGSAPVGGSIYDVADNERRRLNQVGQTDIELSGLKFEADRRAREQGLLQMQAEERRSRGGLEPRPLFNAGRTSFETSHGWNPNNPVGEMPPDSPFKQKFPWEAEGSPEQIWTDADAAYYIRERGGSRDYSGMSTSPSAGVGTTPKSPMLNRSYGGGGYQAPERPLFAPDYGASMAKGMAPLGQLTPDQRQTGRRNYK